MEREKPVFRARYDDGLIIEWARPQTWRNVFSMFKRFGEENGRGRLYCGDVMLRETGTEEAV